MPWAKRAMGAGAVVLFLVAGCTVPDYLGLNFLQSTGPDGDRVVAGSVESVSQSTQSTLRQLGLSAIVTEQADAVRITSKTRNGDDFAIVLTRVRSQQGEQTRVRIEWEDRRDDQTGLQILGQLNIQTGAPGSSAQK